MNIDLLPKYQIGQKLNEETYLDKSSIEPDLIRELYVSNIFATYNFKTQEISYRYELRFIEDDFVYMIASL